MDAVVAVALPVFAIIAAGFAAGKSGALTIADSEALNKFVFRLAMPVALFGLAARNAPPGADDAGIALAYAGAASLALIVGYFLAGRLFALQGPEAGAHAFAATLGNAVFLGLPIALNVEGWARPFIVLMLIEGTLVIAAGAALMSRRDAGAGLGAFLAGPMKNPLVLGMLAGFVYSLLGLPLEGPFAAFFDFLGRAAGPTALVSLGLFLATHQFPPIGAVAGRVAMIGAVKMALLPAVALGVAFALGVSDPNWVGALALFVFTPSAVGSFVMASQYGVSKTETAAAVFATTILSILTISGVLVVFA
ncbi:MAG: AEC family transporter [Pseudomonadota bacterium]